MPCSAFTDTLHPCPHDTGSQDRDLCDIHTTFYDPDTWFDRYVFSPYREQYYFSSSVKLQAIYTKAILEGRVKITRDHFRDLETCDSPESLVDYYLLCCRQPHVDPTWSSKLFGEAIKTILTLHISELLDIIRLNPNLLYRFLDPLFGTRVRSFDFMVSYALLACMKHTTNNSYANLDRSISLIQYIKSHPEFIDRVLLGHSCHIQSLSDMVDGNDTANPIARFLGSLPQLRKAYMEQCQEKTKHLRECLSYAVWKPEMFLDHVGYGELVSRWPKFSAKSQTQN